MGNVVNLKIYDPNKFHSLLTVNKNEVMRYGGMMTSRSLVSPDESDEAKAEVIKLIDECMAEAMPVLTYKVCYRRVRVDWEDNVPVLPFDHFGSLNLANNLKGCNEAVMFGATIGVGIDRLITKYNHLSPSKALIMQALGAERVEALCDLFNDEIKEEAAGSGLSCKPRFSPGYGDLPLAVQKEFVAILDCAHLIGINLNESMLMSPSKSVTAIIGLYGSI
ncbi:MAG: Vitamin B12 dependent methionine synthase activation subunit [Lachnospiraceae bacterium]|nr:Vitamin B12 dependent methionine synthase activation subunit [Lachnospiraceae bacterium]